MLLAYENSEKKAHVQAKDEAEERDSGSGDQKNDNLEVALARLPGRYPFQE
jgi:hypothetical protein